MSKALRPKLRRARAALTSSSRALLHRDMPLSEAEQRDLQARLIAEYDQMYGLTGSPRERSKLAHERSEGAPEGRYLVTRPSA